MCFRCAIVSRQEVPQYSNALELGPPLGRKEIKYPETWGGYYGNAHPSVILNMMEVKSEEEYINEM